MSYNSIKDILTACKKDNLEFYQVILNEQVNETLCTKDEIFEKMHSMYNVMKQTITEYDKNAVSSSKMAGGNGELLHQYNTKNETLLGKYLSKVIENAVKTAESNACMKRIVAAPTAGSCGIIPAVFITFQEQYHIDENEIIKALLVSSGIGNVIAQNASISGAQGGCQAEIGSASAMAAGGLAYLNGGDNETIVNAASIALKNMLGLVCDPVAGLVEVPCIKRNATGASNAVVACQMALAGIKSIIPLDEIIDSMYEIGCTMPSCLKETSQAGLAVTPTAKKIEENLRTDK